MKVLAAIVVTLCVVALAAVWAAGGNTLETYESNEPFWTRPITIANFPNPQSVAGTVDVGNLPAVQQVSGSVEVTNLPSSSGPPVFQFVGFSTATFDGGAGVGTYTLACQVDFSGSRMCFTSEILATVAWPPPPASQQEGWVQPVFIEANRDVSGRNSTTACAGWSDSQLPDRAPVVVADPGVRYGSIAARVCGDTAAVACCAPVE
jgi:hypothetical protein